ncbi:MAG: membrane protein insertase YidC [Dysgonamonadaceae bacterium]|jgi:YidC/Oxa1 family membrane protein insertase|nr:membrane protein insertase YidC [Dysgonamonadaceae bacterium]
MTIFLNRKAGAPLLNKYKENIIMLMFLYTLVIFPIVQFIELCYLFVYRIFDNPGISVLGVSITVSICTLPLYFVSEKHQHKERDLQNRLKSKIDKIKAVFKGDEQYMILSTYYRQNHYHPVYALRNTFGILIQIPFFIAAYSYISHLEALQGAQFLYIHDLSKPDALLSIGGSAVNILPILMTCINIISGTIYTKELAIKDRIQVYGMAVVFLILLYNSPAGLVLYWTTNNISSLVKNILQKTKHAKKIIYIVLCVFVFFLDIFVLFFHTGYWLKRILLATGCSIIFFLPLLGKLIEKIKQKYGDAPVWKDTVFWQDRMFICASLSLFLLAGLVIPSSLIASSVAEFSFIEQYTSPLPFIFHTALQAAGVFLFWNLCIYFLFSKKVKIGLTIFTMMITFIALIDTFLIPENFGFLTNTMLFSDPKPTFSQYDSIILNMLVIIFILGIFIFILLSKRKRILFYFNIITTISLIGFGILNIGKIAGEFIRLQEQRNLEENRSAEFTPVYTFSQNGKNVLFIMLDRGVSGYVPAIFEEKPELVPVFSGFTWYPNCASFAGHTLVGAPPLYGGYEYSPKAINARDSVTLLEKHKEAYLLLPKFFMDAGYSVTVTDPPFDNYEMTNLSIFNDYPSIHAENINRKYSKEWLYQHPGISGMLISKLLHDTLLRFSLFKMVPLSFRLFIYDGGEWLMTANANSEAKKHGGLTIDTIDDYALLDFLPELTRIEQEPENQCMIFYVHLTHSPAFLQVPDYVPAQIVTNKGNGPFAEEDHYHVNMAAFLLLGKWFSFLKENGVYDNTRIIIVADHGSGGILRNEPQNITLPNGDPVSAYNPLLMVKDFNSDGTLTIDDSFMTNADAPLFSLQGIVPNPVNPFTGIPLQSDKAQGIDIVTIGVLHSRNHTKYQYRVGKNQWLHVKENIFKPENWSAASKQ